MSDELSESGVVDAVAQEASSRVTRKVIAELQKMNETQSGDDSGLETVWDEVCVQKQFEESIYWDAYDETVRGVVSRYIAELPKHEVHAIWFQTDIGFNWNIEEPEDRETNPIIDDDIVEYLVSEFIYEEASRWSSPNIRDYIKQTKIRD